MIVSKGWRESEMMNNDKATEKANMEKKTKYP